MFSCWASRRPTNATSTKSKPPARTVRELKRQFDSGLYERLALSRDKDGIRQLAQQGQIVSRPQDLLKEPLVLEFLGLSEQARYSESDLEGAIISQIKHFLLELGKGFLFEARQKRFTFDDDHFFVDLVFYNRLLRCYVLIDLKIGKLTHQDLGQMQMYLNYFDRHVKTDAESATIGILLCKKKHEALVEITLPKDANTLVVPCMMLRGSSQTRRRENLIPTDSNHAHPPHLRLAPWPAFHGKEPSGRAPIVDRLAADSSRGTCRGCGTDRRGHF